MRLSATKRLEYPLNNVTLLEILSAAHLTRYVSSDFEQRGGIMLVGAPATLKTTFIKLALEDSYDALALSDLNQPTLVKLRGDINAGRYSTLAFTEYEKLYQRQTSVASNLEGSIKQLVEEGFQRASFEEQRMAMTAARALVIGAMTPDFYARKYEDWHDSGFLRRFLWCTISLRNADKLMDAIADWKPLDLGEFSSMKRPANKSIPYNVTENENNKLRAFIREQPGEQTPYVLIKKILCVLKWKYERTDPLKPMKILTDFAPCLSRDGADIIL